MKKLLCILLTLILICAQLTGFADSTEDGFEYEYNEEGITITRYFGSATDLIIPDTINGMPVTEIGGWVFFEKENLKNVTIPATITNISIPAFSGSNLTNINVNAENLNFASEDGVLFNKNKSTLIKYPSGNTRATYTIPNTVTTIGILSFYPCTYLTEITLPSILRLIRDDAFADCINLNKINIPKTVSKIGKDCFSECYKLSEINVDQENLFFSSQDGILFNRDKTILIKFPINNALSNYIMPNSVESIADNAFSNCNWIINIVVSENLKTIGSDSFIGCQQLQSIQLPSDNPTFDENDDPNGLIHTIKIPNKVESIGIGAFAVCTAILNISISASVKSIGDQAFTSCTSLDNITVDNNNQYYSSEDGVLFDKGKTTLIKYPTNNCKKNYNVPNTVVTICQDSFQRANNLENINITDNVLIVGTAAFSYCNNLTTITMGNSVQTINDFAFDCCYKLTSINLPKSLTYMDSEIFFDCPLLTIHGYNNTLAQDYATKNNIPFIGEENTPIYIENVQLNSETNYISATIFNYSSNEITSAKVGCATYDINGKLIELKLQPIENLADKAYNTLSFQLQNTINIYNYKVFLWNNLQDQQPLCPTKAKM